MLHNDDNHPFDQYLIHSLEIFKMSKEINFFNYVQKFLGNTKRIHLWNSSIKETTILKRYIYYYLILSWHKFGNLVNILPFKNSRDKKCFSKRNSHLSIPDVIHTLLFAGKPKVYIVCYVINFDYSRTIIFYTSSVNKTFKRNSNNPEINFLKPFHKY